MTVDLIDEDGTFLDQANAHSVHVDNVAPTIAISGNANVNEGSVYTLNLGAVTDPGTDTVTDYVVHWGDGDSDTYSTAGDKTHTYADGASDHDVTVDLIDEDGTFLDQANAHSVHVVNVAPTIAISGDASVNEGSVYTPDPGRGHRSRQRHRHRLHRPLGRRRLGHVLDGRRQDAHLRRRRTDHDVTVDLTDEDGTFLDRANALSVHVNNVAPSIAISGAANVNEGSPTA